MAVSGWIGVDLDGTLAKYDGWNDGQIGDPIPLMVKRVKVWLAEGTEVRIMTARVATSGRLLRDLDNGRKEIEDWCKEHIGQALAITCQKDFAMIELWDDRAVTVEMNTGKVIRPERT